MARTLLLALLLAAPPAAGEKVEFSGGVKAGQTWSRLLPRVLMFCLQPRSESGWDIVIARTCDEDDSDFVSIATPLYRGPNSRMLSAWHFLPDAKLFSNTREFRFVLNEVDEERIALMLRMNSEAGEVLEMVDELGQGRGKFHVLDAQILPGEKTWDTKFVSLRFRVELVIPDEPKRRPGRASSAGGAAAPERCRPAGAAAGEPRTQPNGSVRRPSSSLRR